MPSCTTDDEGRTVWDMAEVGRRVLAFSIQVLQEERREQDGGR
jgi:hypothetical protein